MFKVIKALLTSIVSLNWKQYSVHFLSESRDQTIGQAQIQRINIQYYLKLILAPKHFKGVLSLLSFVKKTIPFYGHISEGIVLIIHP